MSYELRVRNQSQQQYNRALSQAWMNNIQTYDPSVWLLRDPEIEEKMLRDADIAHAIGFRRHLIAGRQWQLVPQGENTEKGELCCTVGTALINRIKHFTQARLNLSRAFFSGARFARIHGRPMKLALGDGKVRTWWVPVRLEDLDKRNYRIVPDRDYCSESKDWGLEAHWERWNVAKADWEPETKADAVHTIRHVYQDDQATLGYGRALREALGWWWYAKTNVFDESLQAVERFSQGVVRAKIAGLRDAATGLPNSELVNKWTDVLERTMAQNIMVHDADDDVDMIQMNSAGWELQKAMRQELRSTIFTLVLGANLTTAADSGGSYALAEIQENSTEALIQFDRETLEETLSDDLIGCIWLRNWKNMNELGIQAEMPSFSITQEKKQEPKERAEVAKALSEMGVLVAKDEVYEQTGFRKPKPGEETVEKAEPQTPQQGAFPFG